MTRWEHTWVTEVLAAFAPGPAPGPASIRPNRAATLAPRDGEVDYLRTFLRLIAGSTPLAALGLRFALWMVVLAPVWLLGRFATFSELARVERTELLSKLLRHTSGVVRELSLLLKFTAAVALLGTPSVRERSGYDNPQHAATAAREASRRVLPLYEARDASAVLPSDRVAS